MIIFYTMAYNAEQTLPRTIQSVLDQTEPGWIWYLLDNGSQDSTGKIINEHAGKDPRIVPLRNEKNMAFTPDTSFFDLACRHDDTDWFCFLDADDIYYADFAEQMLVFTAKYKLDVAACGTDFVDTETGKVRQRILGQDLILTRPEEFGTHFLTYHQFMRTNWGKFFSVKILKRLDASRIMPLYYGTDTLYTQEALRNANRFGIFAKSLHRYYAYPKSRSYQWDPLRFESDKILYQLACSFLTDKCGTVSAQNRQFLQSVYSDAVADTIDVIHGSSLSVSDKLREYRAVATHPLTMTVYRECKERSAARSQGKLILKVLQAGAALKTQDDEGLRDAMKSLLPCCGRIVSGINAQMFLEDPRLMQALLQDNAAMLLQGLLTRMEKNQGSKKYAIPVAIQALAADNLFLCQISDTAFLRKYSKIYLLVWKEENLTALDEMTGILLEGKVSAGQETFLQLYISLSAALEQIPAFIFGKFQLAQLYFRQNRLRECQAIVSELREMGLKDNEELDDLENRLRDMGHGRSRT